MPLNKKYTRQIGNILTVFILCAGFFAVGYHKGLSHISEEAKAQGVINTNGSTTTTADFSLFWKTWNILNEKRIKDHAVSDQDKVWGAIKGLASSYNDPYTEFFPPAEAKEFQDSINGSFGGVGIEIGIKDKVITVISPLKNTPAEKAGIKAGDKILKIDKSVTSDMSIEKAISLIRGEVGTKVALTIYTEGDKDSRDVELIRSTIDIPTLETEKRPDGIFVIRLFQFSRNAQQLFADALNEFANSGDKKLILDLRGNPGGFLDVAVDMASRFVPEGKKIVTEDYGTQEDSIVYRSHGYTPIETKMAVLVDEGSASASEILAGALQENGIAKLVGETTYGKGVVQELVDIADGAQLKVTVARWLTPKGNSINEHGITPDYVVHISKDDIAAKKDPQMEKAVQLLLNN